MLHRPETWRSAAQRTHLVVIGLALALGACAPQASAAAQAQVSPERAHALVAEGATLLDVRSPAEWGRGHLDGAVLVPVQELARRLDEVPRDRPVVVYCHSGARSAEAARTLREAGYEVHDLGGMSRWRS